MCFCTFWQENKKNKTLLTYRNLSEKICHDFPAVVLKTDFLKNDQLCPWPPSSWCHFTTFLKGSHCPCFILNQCTTFKLYRPTITYHIWGGGTIWGWKRWILVEPDGKTVKTIPSHGRVIQTLALFKELGMKITKHVILVRCVSAMFLDTKYSICVSNKYVINEKQSYLTDVVKACHTYGKLPPICDFSLVPNHLWQQFG